MFFSYVEDLDGFLLFVIIKFFIFIFCYFLFIKIVFEELYFVGIILVIKEFVVWYGKRGGYVICVDIFIDIVEIYLKDKFVSLFMKILLVVFV